jgi:hypothetical protein
VSVSQGRTSETSRFVTAIEVARMEMGRNWYGFHHGVATHTRWFDSIWVIVDRLTKVAHFIPVKTTYTGARLAELSISRIVCLHGVPKKIVLDRGTQFTSRFGGSCMSQWTQI